MKLHFNSYLVHLPFLILTVDFFRGLFSLLPFVQIFNVTIFFLFKKSLLMEFENKKKL